MSPGTVRPASATASRTPMATKSAPANIAVGRRRLPVPFRADRVGHFGQPVGIGLVVVDVGDPPVSETDEMSDHEGGARGVVVGDHVEGRGPTVPADHDRRYGHGYPFEVGP